MKNSIGSLAALAAFVAPALAIPLPDPVSASFHHEPVSLEGGSETTTYFDIDGDGANDFFVYGNYGDGLRLGVVGDTLRSASPLAYGDLFFPEDATADWTAMIWSGESVYWGFSFVTGEIGSQTTHAAWVLFDTNPANPMIVGGGWQTEPGQPVVVGSPSPIPEPASFATLAGAAMLTGALATRRRRAGSPGREAQSA